MIQRTGTVATPEASRILQRLCFHFSKKIEVRWDEHEGSAQFPWGQCQLSADANTLRFDCTAEGTEDLGRVQFAIDEHIKLFSRKAPLTVVWKTA